jgi:hypothetical protein
MLVENAQTLVLVLNARTHKKTTVNLRDGTALKAPCNSLATLARTAESRHTQCLLLLNAGAESYRPRIKPKHAAETCIILKKCSR